ncbi:MAG: hypothetical protein PHY47_14470 [Lachnospiraceae bacterium]|nr:hypothetical protein [Lachnospiraceae bacterium]
MKLLEIETEVNNVFINVFNFHPERLSEEQKKGSLFKQEIGFSAIDLFVLFMELENLLQITFVKEDIIENRFDSYYNIVKAVQNCRGQV